MANLRDWQRLISQGFQVFALEANTVERKFIFAFFGQQAQQQHLPCYYWNLGYDSFQQLVFSPNVETNNTISQQNETEQNPDIQITKTIKYSDSVNLIYQLNSVNEEQYKFNKLDIIEFIYQAKSGIYLIEDWIIFDELPELERRKREAQIQNLIDRLRVSHSPCYVIFIADYILLSHRISAEVPLLKYPLPSETEVKTIVNNFVSQQNLVTSEFTLHRLVVSCQGLARGEIALVLSTQFALAENTIHLADLILSYKKQQLRGLGLEFIAEPDVESAGGLDLLQQFLYDKVVKLNEPTAKKYNLRPPRGMLLMGPPGTGKTLCAKLTAKALGYSLIALSWGNVLGSDNPDYTLAKILEVADTLDKCILLADDFDKGFTGWESGGISRRLSQRLLTWMQEHTSHVMMVATVNRIQLLPSEIKRRFDDGGIWFIDLPSLGALYDIFKIHLKKYFPEQFRECNPWNDRDWYRLLKQYKGCTPVEVANAVAQCAIDFYCSLSSEQRQQGTIAASVKIEQLLAQLKQFQKASVRDSEDIMMIRNTAYYARPASSPDSSKFAIPKQELFEYQPHDFDEV